MSPVLHTLLLTVLLLLGSTNQRVAGAASCSRTQLQDLSEFKRDMNLNRFDNINGVQSMILRSATLTAPTRALLNNGTSFLKGLNQSLSILDDCNVGKSLMYILEPTRRDHTHCNWGYVCDYDSNRLPQYLCQARCKESCSGCPIGHSCQPVYYKTAVLRLNNPNQCRYPFAPTTPQDWHVNMEAVPVACTCKMTI